MKNHFDLELRTFQFTKDVSFLIKRLPKNIINFNFSKQLIRSASAIGANYIEANEPLGRKDLIMRMRIARKEAKESTYWLKLILETNDPSDPECNKLFNEAMELKLILSKIIENLNKTHI